MTNEELLKLVDNYNNSFWLSWFYAIKMWYYYGSVAEATEQADVLRTAYSSLQEDYSRAGMGYAGRGMIRATPATDTNTKRRRTRQASSDFRRTEREERENYRRNDDDDDDGMGVADAVLGYEILSSFGSDTPTDSPSNDAPFGGGGDFGGGGAGGSWDDGGSNNYS